MALQRISMINNPRQRFTIRLGENTYRFRITWFPLTKGWYMDIANNSGTSIISGIRMTNRRRLLIGYRINFPGDIFIEGRGEPGRHAWTDTHQLLWIENE